MNCARCSTHLRPLEYEGVEVFTCDGCGGEFLGPAELSHIVTTREARFDPELVEALQDHNPIFGVPAADSHDPPNCPACARAMTPINYGGDTGIRVDRCPSCAGVWLDRDELEKVQILMERWSDVAPVQLRAIATQLEQARQRALDRTDNAFSGSRFSFVNALINRLLDAA